MLVPHSMTVLYYQCQNQFLWPNINVTCHQIFLGCPGTQQWLLWPQWPTENKVHCIVFTTTPYRLYTSYKFLACMPHFEKMQTSYSVLPCVIIITTNKLIIITKKQINNYYNQRIFITTNFYQRLLPNFTLFFVNLFNTKLNAHHFIRTYWCSQ